MSTPSTELKSAEEWLNEVGETVGNEIFTLTGEAPGENTLKLLRQIQLNAIKHGMTLAAKTVKHKADYSANPKMIECSTFFTAAILAARDNLTTLS